MSHSDHGSGASVWTMIVGAVLLLFGIPILAGGVWLISLGGSWYYAPAGLALVLSGYHMMRGHIGGAQLYVLTWVATLIWAYWEVGFDGWALVPRVVAPTVLLILVLTTIPSLARRKNAATVLVVTLLAAIGMTPDHATAQETADETAQTGPTVEVNEVPADAASPEAEAEAEELQPAEESTPENADDPAATPTDESASENTDAPAEEPQAAQAETTTPAKSPEADPMPIGSNWAAYAGNNAATRYSPLDQITPDNVANLTRAFVVNTGDLPEGAADGKYSPENTPLVVDGRLYTCTAMNQLIAYDATNGDEIWRYDPEVPAEAIPYGATCRGIAWHQDETVAEGEACRTKILEATLDARLIAVDAETGELCQNFGENGQVDLHTGIGEKVPGWYAVTAAPTVVGDKIVVGAQVKDGQAENAPSGVIRAYDVATGELDWAWDMCRPDLTGLPPEGETYTRGTPNMWTAPAADAELGLVYLPLGNSSVDYYGGNRKECENEYSSSLVALNIDTGKPEWKFQTVHYDVWDYDLGAQPTIVDLPKDGEEVPAIILPTKQGPIYVLDRRTGKPLFPVKEQKVPSSGGVEPDNISETQPYSEYADLSKSDLTERDMWGMSPLDQLYCRIQFQRANYRGQYEPPSADRPWIQYPGYNGGSDWGSIAIDTEKGILIANYNDTPNYNRLIPREEADTLGLKAINEGGESNGPEGAGDPQIGSPYAIQVNAGWRVPFTGLLCKEPPYGWIRAIDLATGETLWDRAFGEAVRNGPFGIPSLLPITIGTPNNGGPIVTAGGLIFVAATTDNLISAIDVETGETLWQDSLPGGGQTTPITYEVDGTQYVAIMPGGHHFMETPVSDALIVYSLDGEAAQ